MTSRSGLYCALAALALLLAGAGRAGAVTLIEDCQARCTLVVPAGGSGLIRAAAEDLRQHLRRMSGADVPLVTDPAQATGVPVYVGVTPAGEALPVDLADKARFQPDGYLILADDRRVALLAPRPEGVSNAVYGLLEDTLGCHWFTPGEIGTHVPKRATVRLSLPGGFVVAKPDFEVRAPWYNGNAVPYALKEEMAHLSLWRTRNRAGGVRGYAGQEWSTFFPRSLQEKEPGLQAMVNGKRAPRGAEAQICIATPRAVEIARDHFVRVFQGNADLDYWTFSPNDNDVWCPAPAARARRAPPPGGGPRSPNRGPGGGAAPCPGKRITILPYSSTIAPPAGGMKVAPNIIPIICSYSMEQVLPKTADTSWCNTFRRRVEGWMKISPCAWSYDYIGWYPGPWTLFHKLQAEQDYYRAHGYTGMMPEYLDRNLGTDVHMWLSYRIAWDKSRKVDALLEEFYPAYFGPAAGEMRALYEKFEQHMLATGGTGEPMEAPRLYPMPMVEEALAQIAAARAKVAGDALLTARLERDENCLKLTRLWLQAWDASGKYRRSGDVADKGRAVEASGAYVRLIDSLKGTLTVGYAARAQVAASLEALNDPGTLFPKAGAFHYVDSLDDGGKVFQAKSRSGFRIDTYGLGLAPGATGEVVYDVRAGEGLKFKDAHLFAMYLALPEGGHNEIAVSRDDGRTWTVAYQDTRLWGGTAEPELTAHVSGAHRFLLRFTIRNSGKEILGMDNWGIAGTVE